MVSDWLDPLESIEAMIRHYASVGVRGHLVQVLDPAEEDLPFNGHVKFEGLESEGQHTIRRVETAPGPNPEWMADCRFADSSRSAVHPRTKRSTPVRSNHLVRGDPSG